MSAAHANAARRFFATAISEHGIREGNRVRIPMRQCELARRSNVAPSTVGAYLTAMGDTVVSRHPEIVIATEDQVTAGFDASAPNPASRTLVDLVADLLDVQSRLIRAIGQLCGPDASATELTRESREFPRSTRGSSGARRQEGREEAPSFPLRHEELAESATPARGFARLHELLDPLHRMCLDLGLTPLNNRGPVEEALAPYDDETVSSAVREIERDVRSGRLGVTSPFGLLVARARRGELCPPVPREIPALQREPERVEPSDDDLGELIGSYEADPARVPLLRELDADIEAEIPLLLSRGIPAPMLRALRADALRARRAYQMAGSPAAIG